MSPFHRLSSLLLTAAWLFASCTNPTDDAPVPAAEPHFSLTAGTSWKYTITVYTGDAGSQRTLFYSKKVLNDSVTADGLFTVVYDSVDAFTHGSFLFSERPEGYFQRRRYGTGPGPSDRDTVLLIYPYPAPERSVYLVNPMYSAAWKKLLYDTMTVVSRNTVVTVPAGRFSCYEYITKRNTYTTDSLNNPVVLPNYYIVEYVGAAGLIKTEYYSASGGSPVEATEQPPFPMLSMDLTGYTER
jgi:hypothetical protein